MIPSVPPRPAGQSAHIPAPPPAPTSPPSLDRVDLGLPASPSPRPAFHVAGAPPPATPSPPPGIPDAARVVFGQRGPVQEVWRWDAPTGYVTHAPAPGPAGVAVARTESLKDGGAVEMLQAATGFRLWSAPLQTPPEWCSQGPDGTVFVGGRYGSLDALSSGHGSPLWRVDVGEHLTQQPVFPTPDTMVYLKGGRVVARRTDTGEELWTVANQLGLNTTQPQVLPDGAVLVRADNGLFAFEGKTGRLAWHRFGKFGPPVVSRDGMVVVPGPQGERDVRGLDGRTGDELWTGQLPSSVVGTPAPGPPGRVYLPLWGNRVVALNASNGRVLWEGSTYVDRMAALQWDGDGAVFVANHGRSGLTALGATQGAPLWRSEGGKPVNTPLALAEGLLVAADSSGLRAVRVVPPTLNPPQGRESGASIEVGEEQVRIGGVVLERRTAP